MLGVFTPFAKSLKDPLSTLGSVMGAVTEGLGAFGGCPSGAPDIKKLLDAAVAEIKGAISAAFLAEVSA